MKELKLITETSSVIELWESKSKTPYMIGIFASAETKNANGRVYDKSILEREVEKFVKEKVQTKSAWGELGHPDASDINLDNIAMLIESLEWKGNDVYGKAKILDTPKGQILKTLVKEGNIGVSTRGLGTVNESGRVNDDYNLITIDAVSDASNPGSKFVNGILEGRTFTLPEKDISIDEAREKLLQYQKSLIERMINEL
jgi:hypothetical protein